MRITDFLLSTCWQWIGERVKLMPHRYELNNCIVWSSLGWVRLEW